MRWVLLPGMDGTGRLFDPLVAALDEPSTVVAYAPDTVVRYADQRPELPDDELVLLGESYSGPVAIRLATDPRVRGLVLCASFARLPYPAAFRWLGRTLLNAPVPTRAATELADLRPGLRVCRVDAPHLLLQRQPHAAARELQSFSRSL